ncbi:MAG: hypothetical protein WCG21_14465 [Eubacteriales bacterium]
MQHITFEEAQLLAEVITPEFHSKRATIERLSNMKPDDEESARLKTTLLSRLNLMNDKQFSLCCVYALEDKREEGDLLA